MIFNTIIFKQQKKDECRMYIEKLLGITLGEDLQSELKTGVIICDLANKIWPDALKIIHPANSSM